MAPSIRLPRGLRLAHSACLAEANPSPALSPFLFWAWFPRRLRCLGRLCPVPRGGLCSAGGETAPLKAVFLAGLPPRSVG